MMVIMYFNLKGRQLNHIYIYIERERERDIERERGERERERENVIYEPHGNYKPKPYNRYIHKKEKASQTQH